MSPCCLACLGMGMAGVQPLSESSRIMQPAEAETILRCEARRRGRHASFSLSPGRCAARANRLRTSTTATIAVLHPSPQTGLGANQTLSFSVTTLAALAQPLAANTLPKPDRFISLAGRRGHSLADPG